MHEAVVGMMARYKCQTSTDYTGFNTESRFLL